MPIEVLWLIKGLGPGGAERLLVTHAALAGDGCRIRAAYVVPWKSQLVPELDALGVPCHLLGSGRWYDLRWVPRLRRLLRRERVDVVHVHSPLLASVTRLLLRTMRDRPALLTTEHNVWPRHKPATRLANRLTVGLDDAIVAVSGAVRDSMARRVRGRVEVLAHGIDLERVVKAGGDRAAARAALGVPDDIVVCVTVANLRAEKGYDVLLRAAAKTKGGRAVRFFSVGQGPLEAELQEQAAALGLGDLFTFLGYRPEPAPVLAAADLFVLASRHEGLPLGLMEALAFGLPVVATAVGGVPEAVRDGVEGVLVPPDDPAALAAAIVGLASDPARRATLGAASAARASAFSAERPVRRLEEIYAELASTRR